MRDCVLTVYENGTLERSGGLLFGIGHSSHIRAIFACARHVCADSQHSLS